MNREKKSSDILEIRQKFEMSSSAVFVDTTGVDVNSVSRFRSRLREGGVEFRVCKNTLVKKALKETAYYDRMLPLTSGMTGIAWSFEEPGAAAKVIKNFRKEAAGDKIRIKGAILDKELISPQAVEEQMAGMPGKLELKAKLLSVLSSVPQGMLSLLMEPAQGLLLLLSAKKETIKE